MPGVQKTEVVSGLTPRELYDVVIDYESYPGFFKDFTKVDVLDRDGPVWKVRFAAKVVKEISYTLRIAHDEEALTTRWTFIEGLLVSDSRGGWSFTEAPGGTRIDYEANLEVNAPLPRFIKSRIEDAILKNSIGKLFVSLAAETRRRKR